MSCPVPANQRRFRRLERYRQLYHCRLFGCRKRRLPLGGMRDEEEGYSNCAMNWERTVMRVR